MNRFTYTLLMLLLAGLICFGAAAMAETPKRGGTLQAVISQDMWTMDPIHIQTATGERIIHDTGLGECLYDWDVEKGNFTPRLAAALPTITDGGKVYTIPVRKGVKFHDGSKYDAHAAAYSINRILDPTNKSSLLNKYKAVKKVEATDDYTLKITLETPDNAFMVKLAARDVIAVSQKAVEKYGNDFGFKAFVGTGPFRFVEWIERDRIVVERNPNYWKKGLPYLDKIIFKYTFDEELALLQLELDKVHILSNVALKYVKTLQADNNIEVKLIPGIQHEQIYLNTKMKPFNDIRVRRALAHAIDRQGIIEGVFEGYAMESVGPYHPWFWTHNSDFKQPYPYDPEKARNLLAEAGYGPNNPLKFQLMVTNKDVFVEQATMIQAFMQDVGVQVEVLPLEKSTLLDRVYVRRAFKGKPELFQAALEDWGSDAVDPEYSAEQLFSSGSVFNKSFYADPETDKLFEEVKFAKTIEEQKQFYHKTEALIAGEVPTVWICNPKEAVAFRKDVRGFVPNADNRMPLEKVWLAN
ncbi:MAG TPA: ABC transporter substrate-binding protein [Deltaproteobacteria bacterium]|nr:ABC transporter substrate-binding protein [Deltaproteobacteria bacterium]